MRCLLFSSKRGLDAVSVADGVRVARTMLFGVAVMFVVTVLLPTALVAQDAAVEEVELGGVEKTLKTKDGLEMACVYYEGPRDKETIPVVLIHGWKGQGSDFEDLALFLQSDEGGAHSVIVPDLRGHGGSTVLKAQGQDKTIELNSKRTGKAEFQAMVKFDLEAVKTFLMSEHQEEALNIDSLTVVGADMGALLALYWTARDWSWAPLAGVKQGQDVKAVVLLSPPTSFKGVTPQVALKQKDLQSHVSLMLMYGGDDSKASSGVNRLYNTVKRHRKQDWKDKDEERKKKDLFRVPMETTLQGVELLKEDDLPVKRYIGQFIHGRVRVRMEEEFPWKERRRAIE